MLIRSYDKSQDLVMHLQSVVCFNCLVLN